MLGSQINKHRLRKATGYAVWGPPTLRNPSFKEKKHHRNYSLIACSRGIHSFIAKLTMQEMKTQRSHHGRTFLHVVPPLMLQTNSYFPHDLWDDLQIARRLTRSTTRINQIKRHPRTSVVTCGLQLSASRGAKFELVFFFLEGKKIVCILITLALPGRAASTSTAFH